jgi:uncharacterized protein (UPF0332 family)
MSLHRDLLQQARSLVSKEPRRPKQASLRRAVSAAYYALFHLLISESSRLLIAKQNLKELRTVVSRAFVHEEMKKASQAFAFGLLPTALKTIVGVIPSTLKQIADTFVELQEARYEADYDVGKTFTRSEVLELVRRAEDAFQIWSTIRGDKSSDVYLASLLLWTKWRKGITERRRELTARQA